MGREREAWRWNRSAGGAAATAGQCQKTFNGSASFLGSKALSHTRLNTEYVVKKLVRLREIATREQLLKLLLAYSCRRASQVGKTHK